MEQHEHAWHAVRQVKSGHYTSRMAVVQCPCGAMGLMPLEAARSLPRWPPAEAPAQNAAFTE